MPYGPGDTVRAAGAQKYQGKQLRAFKAAFNSCHEQGHEESRCFKIAHAAARRAGDGDDAPPMDGDGMAEGPHHDDE